MGQASLPSKFWAQWATLSLCCWFATASSAVGDLARWARRAARIADDVPISRLDDVVKNPRTSRLGRELLEKQFPIKHLDDAVERSRLLSRAFRELAGVDVGRHLDDIARISPTAPEAALVITRGARHLGDTVPDIALRTRLLREGGAETLAAVGRYDDLAEDLVRFDAALRTQRLPSPPGVRALTLADFGSFFHTLGQRGHHFWTKYVRPHWPLWVGGAALAAVLLAPDEFLDGVGNLTAEGLEKVTRFGGELLGKTLGGAAAGVVKGVGEGVKTVVEGTAQSAYRTFFTSWSGLIALAVILLVIVALVPGLRKVLFSFFALLGLCGRKVGKAPIQGAP
jgi:hypothetical protein